MLSVFSSFFLHIQPKHPSCVTSIYVHNPKSVCIEKKIYCELLKSSEIFSAAHKEYDVSMVWLLREWTFFMKTQGGHRVKFLGLDTLKDL